MTDPKGIASLVTKRLSAAPTREGGDADGDLPAEAATPDVDSGEDVGVAAASEEIMAAFKSGDATAFGEALTGLIELVMAKAKEG